MMLAHYILVESVSASARAGVAWTIGHNVSGLVLGFRLRTGQNASWDTEAE